MAEGAGVSPPWALLAVVWEEGLGKEPMCMYACVCMHVCVFVCVCVCVLHT